MSMRSKANFWIVLVITLLVAWIAFFGIQFPGSKTGTYYKLMGASDMRFGIDIRGGVDATFVPKGLDRAPSIDELEAARTVIETRLDQNNILDREVTLDPTGGMIIVRFPWKSDESDFDPQKAIDELGAMAHLTFKDPDGAVVIEGSNVVSAVPTTSPDYDGSFVVELTLNSDGQKKFAEATGRLIGKKISIYMDEILISDPTVQTRIDSESCIITGMPTLEVATTVANQINSGALPFSLTTQNFSTISPSLGANSLEVMVQAGLWAFALLCLALMLYYRASGIVAAISLLLQVAGQLILLTWPQFTVTLPGIAGIILSIGMGVDANVIVAERIREELREGKGIDAAVMSGFKRAFSSVFDGNITVLIVAVIMMWLGSGAILSFAYTLLFGIIMNFIAGVTATRLMTYSLIQFKPFRSTRAFMSDKYLGKGDAKIFPFFSKRKVYFAVSAAIMVIGLIAMFTNGVTLDISFKGGTLLNYSMNETMELNTDEVGRLAEETLPDHVVTVQVTTDFATGEKHLKLSISGGESLSNEDMDAMSDALNAAYPEQNFALDETNSVTASFGRRFLTYGMMAVALSFLLVIIYVWFSFRKIHGLSAGTMSLLSLLHDVLVVFFTFVAFRIPIGDSFVAVVLTILGYSINDTIVIYDRIRENSALYPRMAVEDMVDKSISQSFTRSLNTNLAVFVSVLLVYVFAQMNGLDSIREFALPMAIGTISGCYSTVCIAGPAWTMWQKRRERKNAEAPKTA